MLSKVYSSQNVLDVAGETDHLPGRLYKLQDDGTQVRLSRPFLTGPGNQGV